VDHYFRPKSIGRDEVLNFNNDVVLLQNGLQRTYRGGKRLGLKLLVSNYSAGPLEGELTWQITAGNQSLARQRATLGRVPQGELSDATPISVQLPEVASPTKLILRADLVAGPRRFRNDWSTWLYPAVIHPPALSVPVFAATKQMNLGGPWGAQPIPATGALSDRAVYVTDWPPEPRLLDALGRGASIVVLEGGERLLKSYPVTFRTAWWKAGDYPAQNHSGTFVYDHPTTRAMAPAGWCDDGWFYLVEGGQKYVLEAAPARPDVIIRALPSMAMLEDEAMLFEVGVDKGCLLVSGLNHRGAADRPENRWLIARLLVHAARFPQPKTRWPASFLAAVRPPASPTQ
jgi:hypothetical protein